MASETVTRICNRFRARLRAMILASGVARLAALAILFAAAATVLDWWIHVPWGWRLLPLLAFAGVIGVLVRFTIHNPLKQRWSDREVLAHLDAGAPAGEGMLLDLYELQHGEGIQEREDPEGAALLDEALARLAPRAEQARVETSLNTRYPNAWMAAGGAVLAVCAVAALLLPEHAAIGAQRFFNPFSTLRWPHRTTIALHEPATGWKVPQGEAFALSAKVTGEIPSHVTLEYLSQDLGFWMEERLAVGEDGRVAYTFPSVNDPLRFLMRGGDYTTDRYDVEIARRPRIERIVAKYEFPDYAGLPTRTVESGQVAGVEGTTVTLTFTASLPLQRAVFEFDGKEEQLELVGETEFRKTLLLEKEGAYTLKLTDTHGFRENKPEVYEIKVSPDETPEVSLLAPGRDLEATGRASVEFSLKAKDDFGLRNVEFLYAIDGGEAKPLSDRITGPLAPRGKEFETRFVWDFARSEWPKADRIVVEYFVRVQDVNPTGKGVVESTRYKVNLLKPSVYREQLFQTAADLLNEALIAEKAQREAYHLGKAWLGGKAGGKEDDEGWTQLTEKQESAFRAARAMEVHLKSLAEQYEMNRIAFEFMSGRLAAAGQNLREVLDTHHPAIEAALGKAKPQSAAEAAEARLKNTRLQAIKDVHDKPAGMKMAALLFQRILYQLYDWRDLQGAAIGSLRITERQEEVADLSKEIAPTFLGKDIRDLSDEEQDRLFGLGKQQNALYDMETALEAQLRTLWYKAETEKRNSFGALKTAFGRLRQARVNDALSRAAHAIQNNQTADILEIQKTATTVVREVTSGLEAAGQIVEKLPPLTLAMDVKKVDTEKLGAKVAEGEAGTAIEPVAPPMRTDKIREDPLTSALMEANSNLLAALKRMTYVHGNMSDEEMPRFVMLKMGMLTERHAAALASLDQADAVAGKEKNEAVARKLALLRREMDGAKASIAQREVMPRAQQVLTDAIESCQDLIQYLARQKAIAEMQAEHERSGGVDAFKRPYVLRESNLVAAVGIMAALDRMRLDVADAARKTKRFAGPAPKDGTLLAKQEKERREPTAGLLDRAATYQQSAREALGRIGDAVRPAAEAKIAEALAAELAKQREALAQGGKDAEVGEALAGLNEKLSASVDGLRDLADARGEAPKPPEEEKAEPPPQEIAKMTEEEFEKLNSPEALAERLREAEGLPKEIRENLLRSIRQPMPEKYRPLLTAFVNACLTPAKPESKKEEAQP